MHEPELKMVPYGQIQVDIDADEATQDERSAS
jgi:hypothetical protein